MIKRLTGILLISLFFLTSLQGQERVTTAGIQFKPIFPSSFFSSGPQNFEEGGVPFTLTQRSGFCAGMVVRKGLSKNFSFETGINFVNRSYTLEVRDSNLHLKNKFKTISYEIPTLILLFVQLSREVYMDVGFGHSLDLFPSDVYSKVEFLSQYGARKGWVSSALLANLGVEYRTPKSGYIYLGASYHRPFSFIYVSEVAYTGNNKDINTTEKLSGNYLTVDIRYFFHADPEKRKRKTRKSN